MKDFTVVMQAKRDLYFTNPGKPRQLFMKKNSLSVMRGKSTVMMGYREIKHNDKNFRLFVPVDILRLDLKYA